MTSAKHSFSAKCRLAPVSHSPRGDGLSPIDAQFFYSLIPIDDPLYTSAHAGVSESRFTRRQLRPFSESDNSALERAWLSLGSPTVRQQHLDVTGGCSYTSVAVKSVLADQGRLVQDLARAHIEKHRPRSGSYHSLDLPRSSTTTSPCCSDLLVDVYQELSSTFCSLARRQFPEMAAANVVHDIAMAMSRLDPSVFETVDETSGRDAPKIVSPNRDREASAWQTPSKLSVSPFGTPRDGGKENEFKSKPGLDGPDLRRRRRPISSHPNGPFHSPSPSTIHRNSLSSDDGISGKPFVRVGGSHSPLAAASTSLTRREAASTETVLAKDSEDDTAPVDRTASSVATTTMSRAQDWSKLNDDIVVGMSRLHKVSLTILQMKPIYWSPINDIALVMRATWFYRDTMLPVAPVVANQLEAGYHELRPWTKTWGDEIRCALEVGPLGEEKISHNLWPQDSPQWNAPMNHEAEPVISSDPFCTARCFRGEAASQGSLELLSDRPAKGSPSRPFAHYHVIYKDDAHAFLLKPSLKPSAYHGRRPVQKIIKGINVDIPVVRRFDRQTWNRVHLKGETPTQPRASTSGDSHESGGPDVCAACKADESRGQVSDLVLVAHGIGQKFAERVESFHFTHAINGFRRAVNMELASSDVQRALRQGQNGLMVLPLNWRMGLSFEDGGPLGKEDVSQNLTDSFALRNIEPDTIPAVRSMISDVMFDIPFYMSHHKTKMVNALVSEANRVYRLWCRNNPGFLEKGRVHLIAHSLGSAMALDILSHQPTNIPAIDVFRSEPQTRHFEFDTKNLFLLGSPAAFFLLLEQRALMPRRGRRKPGADPDDTKAESVVGDAGSFGCLAVDNIYNVLAKEDPIAYLLNGTVDPAYAASLQMAYVPNTSTSILESFGDAIRNVVPGVSSAPDRLAAPLGRPATVRLPSQVELEVHDFTREEIAKKKMILLNDNGQIDFFLRSSGGPLEIQYFNMLSAHTSYWTNQDFIRMLCLEVGREPGRQNTLPAMRAMKAKTHLSPRR